METNAPAGTPGLYDIIPLKVLRRTPGIYFDAVTRVPQVDAIDRVVHEPGGISPGPVEGVDRPFYMHPGQEDNLLVLQGTRLVDIFSKSHGKMESFEITPERIRKKNPETGEWELLFDGAAMLVWPSGVFHRIMSGDDGSISVNFATHLPGFDLKTNFNIYELSPETGEYRVLREGHLDQPSAK